MELDIGSHSNRYSILVTSVQSVMTGFPIKQPERHHKELQELFIQD